MALRAMHYLLYYIQYTQLQSTLYIYHKYMYPSKRPITASGI